MLTKECHIKDILEHLEPTLLTRSYLNAMGSTNVRMLFYGMLRKEMDAPLDSCPAVIAFFLKAARHCQTGSTKGLCGRCSGMSISVWDPLCSNAQWMTY